MKSGHNWKWLKWNGVKIKSDQIKSGQNEKCWQVIKMKSGQSEKWSKLKVVKIKSGQNWKWSKLKVVKIKSGQN